MNGKLFNYNHSIIDEKGGIRKALYRIRSKNELILNSYQYFIGSFG